MVERNEFPVLSWSREVDKDARQRGRVERIMVDKEKHSKDFNERLRAKGIEIGKLFIKDGILYRVVKIVPGKYVEVSYRGIKKDFSPFAALFEKGPVKIKAKK